MHSVTRPLLIPLSLPFWSRSRHTTASQSPATLSLFWDLHVSSSPTLLPPTHSSTHPQPDVGFPCPSLLILHVLKTAWHLLGPWVQSVFTERTKKEAWLAPVLPHRPGTVPPRLAVLRTPCWGYQWSSLPARALWGPGPCGLVQCHSSSASYSTFFSSS